MQTPFKVKDLIDVCGTFKIIITDFNKVKSNHEEIIYWSGFVDDYFRERPYGEYTVRHISYGGECDSSLFGYESVTDGILYLMIDIEEEIA